MKKLMIIAAVAMAAVSVNAAQYVWKTKSAGKIYQAGTTDGYTGTAYIFADAGNTTAEKIFALLADGKSSDALALALDNSAVSTGAITAKPTDTGYFTYGGDINAYAVVVDGDSFFIGGDTFMEALSVGTATIQLDANKAPSQAAAKMVSEGFKGAGWYTAVPEPTSGLLLLLGVAGLALRRRRA